MKELPKEIRDHFVAPRNVGTIENASASASAKNDACGDHLEISIAVEAGTIARIAFRARACSAVIATASLATEAARGRSAQEVQELDIEGLVRAAGGLPPGKDHAHRLVARVLREAVERGSRSRGSRG